jgi:hypothetical protein
MFLLAQIVRLVTAVVVGLIVVGIALRLLDPHATNALVRSVSDVAGSLVEPFKGVFSPDGERLRIALNWGLAAVVYGIAGGLLSRLFAGAAIAAEDRMAAGRRTTRP